MRRILQKGKLTLAALSLAAALLIPEVSAAGTEAPAINAGGAVLIEAGTKLPLYSLRAHEKLPMASTTKIMTALLAIEYGDLDQTVTVAPEAEGVEGSSMYLAAGERISLRDLVYGLMLASGNDAAVAIAIHIGGSVDGFAILMNERARSLGALNTNFVTPNGLPDDRHYTTAYDLALIAAKAMEYEEFRTVVSSEYHKTETGGFIRTLKNKNRLLWEYEGGCGIKTGYTKAAGKCLVFAAERDGMLLIGVVLNCPGMFDEAKEVLDYGFGNYEMARVVSAGDVVARATVEGGETNSLALVAKDDIMIPVKRDSSMEIETRVDVKRSFEAPVEGGLEVGVVSVVYGGRTLAFSALLSAETVEARGYIPWLRKAALRWTA